MKKLRILACFVILSLIFIYCAGCSISGSKQDDNGSGKLKVVTTLFPQYDFAREIAGDKADVRLLLPPGVESHSYEPTPQDITGIKKADVFIYTGEYPNPKSR